MAAKRIPKCIDFFLNSLVRVIQGARSYMFTYQVDSAEFFSPRLNEYERTLRLLLGKAKHLGLLLIRFLYKITSEGVSS